MLKLKSIIVVLLWANYLSANNSVQFQAIEFETGATKLTHSIIKQASSIYNKLAERNFAKILIKGKSEKNWSRADIIQLAKKRSLIIRDFFVGIGCKSSNIKVDYNGVPKVILFKPKGKFSVSGKLDLSSIEQQCFTIKGNETVHFSTKYGNVFVFEPGTFTDESGRLISSEVSLCLWEFANKKDMIKSALSTGDKNQLLETASTFYIQAYAGDKELRVRDSKNFKIYVKRPDDVKGYQAYYGNVKNGNVEWQKDKRSIAYSSIFDEGLINKQNKAKDNVVKMKVSKSGTINKSSDERLLLKSKKIGWVNCDRILNVRNPCSLKLILDGVNEEYNVRLVFKSRNAVVPGLSNSNYTNQYKFSKVPVGETAYVVAYKKDVNGFSIAYTQVTLGFIKSINLKPEFKSEAEFNAILDSFIN